MVNIAVVGCSGKMGYYVVEAITNRNDCKVLFGIDLYVNNNYDFNVYKSFD